MGIGGTVTVRALRDALERSWAADTFTDPAPKTKGYPSTRDYCMSYEDTVRRYRTLAERAAGHIGVGT